MYLSYYWYKHTRPCTIQINTYKYVNEHNQIHMINGDFHKIVTTIIDKIGVAIKRNITLITIEISTVILG